jgi:hypothetical protein
MGNQPTHEYVGSLCYCLECNHGSLASSFDACLIMPPLSFDVKTCPSKQTFQLSDKPGCLAWISDMLSDAPCLVFRCDDEG